MLMDGKQQKHTQNNYQKIIKMELKDVVKEHLVNENEKEITKKIKENSKLK